MIIAFCISSNISVSVEVALLKKYYSVFCNCLPQDFTVTMTRLKQSIHVTMEDGVLPYLLSLSNPAIINENIVAVFFMQLKSKEGLLELCELFERLVDPESKVHVEMFRNGKYHLISWPVAN